MSYDRSIATFFSCQKQGYYGAWGGHCATQGSKSARFLLGSGRSYVSLDVRALSRLRSSIFAGCFFSEHSRRN